MAASARLFRQLAVRATAATGATTLLAAKCDGTKPPGTREPLRRRPSCSASRRADLPEQPPLHACGARRRASTASSRRAVRRGPPVAAARRHVNLAARNGDGLTALLVAARLREHEAAEIIASSPTPGPRSTTSIGWGGRAAPGRAGRQSGDDAGPAAAGRGPAPRRRAARGWAPRRHYAAAFARVDAMAMLCAHDAKAVRDARDRLGRSPLHWSALSAHRPWASHRSLIAARRRRIAGGWRVAEGPRPDGRDAGRRGGAIGSRRVAGPAREARHGPARRARQPRRLAAGPSQYGGTGRLVGGE